MNPLEMVKALGPSIVRTVTTWLVGIVVTLLAKAGLDWQPSDEALLVVSTLVGSGWYILFRWLETKASSKWGWALGLPKAPTYDAPAAPSVDSPTGYEATETSPVPEGEPVAVVPSEDPALLPAMDPAEPVAGMSPDEAIIRARAGDPEATGD